MPSATIRERIMKVLKTTLEGITVTNGYANTIPAGGVQRFTQSGQVYNKSIVIVIHEGTDEPTEGPLAGAQSLTTRKLDVALEVVTRHDEAADARASEEIVNTLRGDVEKALMSNPTWKEGATDLALKTFPPSFTPIFAFEGQRDLTFIAECTVQYRHRRTDPTALG
jgi:hypothetical protein